MAQDKPNIVFIVGDNVGWGDERLGAFQKSAARYPNIKPGEDYTGYK